MRPCIISAAGLLGLLLSPVGAWAATPAGSSDETDQRTVLEDAVRVALQRELDGNDVDRNALLQHVLEQDPEFAPARWHLGYVTTGETWVPHQELLPTATDRSNRLSLYRDYREALDDAVIDHLLIANAAREHEMWDEERAHLMRVVELDWDNAEARRRLGDVKIDGFWVAREEVEAFARNMLRIRRDLVAWSPEVNRIVRRLVRSREAAWESEWKELAAIRDPDAIPAVEQALAAVEGERAALSYLDWLRGLEAWEASVALARQAVFSPSAAVRSRAQQFLLERRIDDYVPLLLGAMRADVNFKSRLFVNDFGAMIYVQRIAYETQSEVRVRNLAVLYGPENTRFNSTGSIWESELPPARIPEMRALVLAHLVRHYQSFTPRQGRAGQSLTQIGNDRASRTLAAAIQIREFDSPGEWWDWWNDYQQVYVSGRKREVEEDYDEIWATERRRPIRRTPRRVVFVRPIPLRPRSGSCFAAGTPVVTEYGRKPIEEIVLGDRVLAQDIDTGQISFKPVFGTTIRPPVRLLRITTTEGELNCTAGHPFWINGLGWRYAWELEPGMRFHAVDGSSEIISIEDSGRQEEAYNLVVADYHNYFVGEDRILSHDNSPRNPTNALVPGLMPDWTAPAQQP